ncbi:hypothetical protein [Robertmurraya sp. DFI.2.37]|uniref:hypothetical protein n=1 Tax=Robertmurraya sp. DFI.2.37 TaxID=3031819 RepID=UPI0012460327|nr:hypothetical protein [Robertmurraya sp. DFI.2.37]
MKKSLLEIIRIIFIMAFLGTLLGLVLSSFYSSFNIETEKYGWIGGVSILIVIFILYRNKLQFSGWYKSKNNKKLSKSSFTLLSIFSILLVLLPVLLSYLY